MMDLFKLSSDDRHPAGATPNKLDVNDTDSAVRFRIFDRQDLPQPKFDGKFALIYGSPAGASTSLPYKKQDGKGAKKGKK